MQETGTWINGGGIFFDVDGVRLYLRQPSTDEYDDAIAIYETVRQVYLAELKDLKEMPVPDLLDIAEELNNEAENSDVMPEKVRLASQAKRLRKWHLNEYIAHLRALKARNRFLARRLLCDEDKEPLINIDNSEAEWESLPIRVRNVATDKVNEIMEAIDRVPFDLAKWRERE